MPVRSSPPVAANYPSTHLTIGAGAAIFHLATARVVLCYHTRDRYHFLPKGRLNGSEESRRAAEHEAFEESGYKCRLLPIAMQHRQPDSPKFVIEPLWTQLVPHGPGGGIYMLFWFVGETVPEAVENGQADGSCGQNIAVEKRIAMDVVESDGEKLIYEPVRHEGTGVDEEEMLYTSALVPVEEACRKLRGSVMEDVVRRGWQGVQLRMRMEKEEEGR